MQDFSISYWLFERALSCLVLSINLIHFGTWIFSRLTLGLWTWLVARPQSTGVKVSLYLSIMKVLGAVRQSSLERICIGVCVCTCHSCVWSLACRLWTLYSSSSESDVMWHNWHNSSLYRVIQPTIFLYASANELALANLKYPVCLYLMISTESQSA